MAISIIDKKDCVGCWACANRCPKQCISMVVDEQGFRYPKVDYELCIECGLCEKVCPVINQAEPRLPLHTYAAKNTNKEVQLASSSGGVFTVLAEQTLKEGGVVFGARFNENWEVVHDFTESVNGLDAFRRSKYVQSIIGDTYKQCENFLKQGRKVMFTGTPCQIAGLKRFLRKDYDNLLTVDFICHGVPSPLVWREYLRSIMPRPKGATAGKNTDFQSLNVLPQTAVSGISFRDKRNGWEKYGFSVRYTATDGSGKNTVFQSVNDSCAKLYEPMHENAFMEGFLKDLYLRPSCYFCPAKSGKSHSDITLADLWGAKKITPDHYDYDGTSLIIVGTSKGEAALSHFGIDRWPISFEVAVSHNKAYYRPCRRPKQADKFWKEFPEKGISCIIPIVNTMRSPLWRRIGRKVKGVIRSCFNLCTY